MMNIELCDICGFEKNRPRGNIFLTKSVVDYAFVEDVRCKKCGLVPDWVLWEDKVARIIYRNFKGNEEYFEKLKQELIDIGYSIFKVPAAANKKKQPPNKCHRYAYQ